MPRISHFFGMTIAMYYNDHHPAHFHALYGEDEATLVLVIDTLEVLNGRLPRRALALALEWAALHRDELRVNWERARQGLPVTAIEPLD